MRLNRFEICGFSLLEVVIAVGIFTVAVSAMLGFLPALTRQSAVSVDTLNATHLPGAIRVELQRLATAGGFDALADQTKFLGMLLPDTCLLVATRDVVRLHSLNYLAPSITEGISEDAQYFLIELWRFSESPLAYDSGGAVLALHVRVSWPYRIPNSAEATALADREKISFNLAINR